MDSPGVRQSRMGRINGSASGGVPLIHNRFHSVGHPHPSASRPPSPPGEGFFRWYHPAKLYRVNRAFPEGEGAPVRTLGRMRATSRKHPAVYQRTALPFQNRERARPFGRALLNHCIVADRVVSLNRLGITTTIVIVVFSSVIQVS